MSSELDAATATRTRSLVYQLEQGRPRRWRGTTMLENGEIATRFFFFFFFFRLALPNLSPRYPRIILDPEKNLPAPGQRDNNGRLHALGVAASTRDRDRRAPRYSAPGRFCAPLTAIICKKKLRSSQARRGTPRGGPVSTLVSATHHPRRE